MRMILLNLFSGTILFSLVGSVFSTYSPRQIMVDLTNDFGVCILQAVASKRENVAFSPYGLVSVGVVLYEGSRGPAAAEIHAALRLPWDRQVTRLGFRDLHRHLKSYFSNDGFLRGLVLSKPNVRLRNNFLKLLRFYGFYTNLDVTTTAAPDVAGSTRTEPPGTPGAATSLPSGAASTLPTVSETATTPTFEENTTPLPYTTEEYQGISTVTIGGDSATTTTSLPTTTESPEGDVETTVLAETATPEEPKITPTPEVATAAQTTEQPEGEPSSSEQMFEGESSEVLESLAHVNASSSVSQESTTMNAGTTIVRETTTVAESLLTVSQESDASDVQSTPAVQHSITVKDEVTTLSQSSATDKEESSTESLPTMIEGSASVIQVSTTVINKESPTMVDESTTLVQELSSIMEDMNYPNEGLITGNEESTTTNAESISSLPTSMSNEGNTESPKMDGNLETTPFEITIVETTVNQTVTTFDPNIASTSFPIDDLNSQMPTAENSNTVLSVMTTNSPKIEELSTVSDRITQENTEITSEIPKREEVTEEIESARPNEVTETDPSTADYDELTTTQEPTAGLTSSEDIDLSSITDVNSSLPTRMPRSLDSLRYGPEHREGSVANWILRGQGPHWTFTLPTEQWFFTYNGGESVPVLTYTAYLPFAHIPDINSLALQLPLDDPRYSMLVVLPEERLGLEAVLESLTWCSLTAILANLKTTAIYAVMPSFTTVKHINLGLPLAQLGVRSIFDPFRADLREMSPERHVFVRTIEQVVTVSLRKYYHNHRWFDATPNDVQQHFVANHPFAYFVLDKETNVALMAGTIVNPITKQNY